MVSTELVFVLFQENFCTKNTNAMWPVEFLIIFFIHAVISVLPSSGPVMTGLREVYLPGEVLSVKCFTQPADPTPEVTMYVNNKQVWNQQENARISMN